MNTVKINLSDILEILTRLASDAMHLGALEVVIKHDKPDRYEFASSQLRYEGYIHPQIALQLIPLLEPHPRLTLTCKHAYIASICLASHAQAISPQLTLSWDLCKKASDAVLVGRADDAERATALTPTCSIDHTVPKHPILIVEDDIRFATLLKSILVDKGWRVELAADGVAAQERLRDTSLETPSLLICDVHMPNMDGVALVTALRAASVDIPILMLTSDDDRLIEVELALLGVNAFVRKQDDPRVLIAWIRNLLSRPGSNPPAHRNGHLSCKEEVNDTKSFICS